MSESFPELPSGQGSFRLDANGVYRCTAFSELPWLTHGFGTRRAALPPGALTLRQVHGDCVRVAGDVTGSNCDGDALITDRIAQTIAIRTADCVPILLVDAQSRAVAAIHAGWRGTAAGIVTRAVERLAIEFGSNPATILAAVGPCIQACCYEVGAEVAAQLDDFAKLNGREKYQLDLAAANISLLENAGIPAHQVFNAALCTCCRDDFYSYRREPSDPGRMLSFICRLA